MPRRTAPADPPADETPDDSGSTAPTATVDPAPESTAGSPPPPPPPPPPAAESGVFTWLRSIEITRRPGWLGGVCAGIAERIGIDPLLVRGIVVVLAVVGAPVALLYAVAWFLLPDEQGLIHAQELGQGRVTRALPGIVAIFLLSFLPLTQGLWYTGALYWSNLDWGGAVVRAVWTGVVLVAGIVLVVWLARRATAEVPTSPATTDDRPETVPAFPASSGTDAGTDPEVDAEAEIAAAVTASLAGAPVAAPGEPPAPPADASAEELAAWKQSQDAWQQQRAAWAAEQKRSERDRRQAEAGIRAAAAAAAARERARIRRLTQPRASAGVVFLVLGPALVASAIAAFAASNAPETRGAEWVIGTSVLVLVLGLGTIVVALCRRRSGALAFFSILSVLALMVAVVVPTDRQPLPLGAGWGIDATVDGRYSQLAGSTSMYVFDEHPSGPATIDLWQLSGSVMVDLEEGATLRLEYTTDSPQSWISVEEQLEEGGRYAQYVVTDGRLNLTVGAGDPDVVLRLWAGRNTNVYISTPGSIDAPIALDPVPDEQHQWDRDGNTTDVPDPTPIPTDVTTGGAP